MVKNVLVTGSEGTLGVPLVRLLVEKGYRVTRSDLAHAHGVHRCDVGHLRQLEELVEETSPDLVFHLAAEFGRHNGERYYEQLWQTNVIGTRNVLEVQARKGFKLIMASSSEVYGENVGLTIAEEDFDLRSPRLLNDYAMTKWVNEQQAINFERERGSQIMRLRFFNAYGPGERFHSYRSVVALFVGSALLGRPFDVYEGYRRTFMHVYDFVPTLANAIERFVPGEAINVGGIDYRDVSELAAIVLKETGADEKLARVKKRGEVNVANKLPMIDKAIALLGHDPKIRLEQGVPLTVAWMRAHLNSMGARAET